MRYTYKHLSSNGNAVAGIIVSIFIGASQRQQISGM